MVVIAIIGILAASLYPSMSNYFLRAKISTQLQQLRGIRTALESYNIDIGMYPISENWGNEYDCYNALHPSTNQKDQWIPWLVSGWYMATLPNGDIGTNRLCDEWLFLYLSEVASPGYKLLSHGSMTAKVVKLSQPELIDWKRDGGVNIPLQELDEVYIPWAYGFWTDTQWYNEI